MQAEVGSTVELGDVLMLAGSDDVRVGTPVVEGARVVAEVMEHGRGRKLLVFKYKNKTRYRRRQGHRQDFTRLAIRHILADGEQIPPAAEAAAPVAAEPEASEKPARQKRSRKMEAQAAAEPESTKTSETPEEDNPNGE